MTSVYVDATTLIALGTIGRLELLNSVGDPLVVLPSVKYEVTTEPARTNLARWMEDSPVHDAPAVTPDDRQAMSILGEEGLSGDTRLVGVVLAHLNADEPVGVVSDDRRVRTITRGLGASVTGTIGVIVRAVEDGLDPADAMHILRQTDAHGLHMTAALRERAEQLIDDAAD